jgi:hypothetical protein
LRESLRKVHPLISFFFFLFSSFPSSNEKCVFDAAFGEEIPVSLLEADERGKLSR